MGWAFPKVDEFYVHGYNIYIIICKWPTKNLLQWISTFEVQKLAFIENTVLIFYKNMDKLTIQLRHLRYYEGSTNNGMIMKNQKIIYLSDILLKTGPTSQIFL